MTQLMQEHQYTRLLGVWSEGSNTAHSRLPGRILSPVKRTVTVNRHLVEKSVSGLGCLVEPADCGARHSNCYRRLEVTRSHLAHKAIENVYRCRWSTKEITTLIRGTQNT